MPRLLSHPIQKTTAKCVPWRDDGTIDLSEYPDATPRPAGGQYKKNRGQGRDAGNVKNAPEFVDPKELIGRLQKLADAESTSGVSRLEDALGKEQAESLLQKAYDASKAVDKRNTAVKVGKVVAKGGALAGLGYGAHRVLGPLSSSQPMAPQIIVGPFLCLLWLPCRARLDG